MKRWLPFPRLSGALLLAWLVLNQSLSADQVLIAGVLAVVVPLLARPLLPPPYPRLARPAALVRLLAMASVEIVRSAFAVGRIILFTNPEGVNAQFIRIPLDLSNPYGLAMLSCLVNTTPGTVWVEILPERVLALHVFDLQDAQWWIDTIKQRYEQPLIEIFEGMQ